MDIQIVDFVYLCLIYLNQQLDNSKKIIYHLSVIYF